MTRPALVRLLVLQTVLLVLVGWAAVYFARDEFLLATAPADDDDAASAPLPDDGEGTPVVRLSAAAQRNVGLALAVPARATLPAAAPELAAFVLDAQPLAELHGRLQAARHEAEAARAVAQASAAERRRVQGLYDDDRNASQRALEAAQAQAAADAARERAAQAQWAALREGARATWGPSVAAWLEAPDGGALPRLAAGREALLRVALRGDGPAPGAALWNPRPGRPAPARALPLGAAALADAPGGSRTLLFHVSATGLAPGQRLAARVDGGASEAGVLLPASALVWHAGQPWVYVRESELEEQEAPAREADGPRASAPAAAAAQASASRPPASAATAGAGSGSAAAGGAIARAESRGAGAASGAVGTAGGAVGTAGGAVGTAGGVRPAHAGAAVAKEHPDARDPRGEGRDAGRDDDDDERPAGKPRAAASAAGGAASGSAPGGARTAPPGAAPRAATPAADDDDAARRGAAPSGAAAAAPAARAGDRPAAAGAADASEEGAFRRRAVPQARRVGEQWFVPGFEEDDPVVVRGAQVLLSEELKYQIRNENDD